MWRQIWGRWSEWCKYCTLSSNKFHCLSVDVKSSVLNCVRSRSLIRPKTFFLSSYELLSLAVVLWSVDQWPHPLLNCPSFLKMAALSLVGSSGQCGTGVMNDKRSGYMIAGLCQLYIWKERVHHVEEAIAWVMSWLMGLQISWLNFLKNTFFTLFLINSPQT